MLLQILLSTSAFALSASASSESPATVVVARVSQGGEDIVQVVDVLPANPEFAYVYGNLNLVLPGTLASTRGKRGESNQTGQTLTTTVQDPDNPEEPWVVTTYRRSGESLQAFVRRHREMVDAVREALGG
jgi:hypothetical protein